MSKRLWNTAEQYGAQWGRAMIGAGLAMSLWASAASATPLFCVLVPHFKDEYWLSVGFGLEQEADRQAVDLIMMEAGGYNARAAQIAQLSDCVARDANAILIGAVSADHPVLLRAIATAAHEVPVYALVNELHSPALSGRVGVDWYDMGLDLGRHMADLHPVGSGEFSATLITGPPESGWTAPLLDGLQAGLADSAVTISTIYGADTGVPEQLALVYEALSDAPDTDILIGSAPAIEAAVGLIAVGDGPTPLLYATYANHSVLRGLMNGRIGAAPFDDPAAQGELAIRQALGRDGTGDPNRLFGPEIVVLTPQNNALNAVTLSPPDYFPDLD